jgi:hypothetical protein
MQSLINIVAGMSLILVPNFVKRIQYELFNSLPLLLKSVIVVCVAVWLH